MKKGKWTDDEILYLKNNYQSKDIKEICNYLDRNINSVWYKASSLKLKYRDVFMEMINILHENNYEMLSTNYENVKSLYSIKCLKHNFEKQTTGDNIMRRKFGCPYCKSEKIHDSLVTDVNIVRNKFIEKGLIPKFNDDDYINNKTPLKYLCQTHNDEYQYISYDSLCKSMFGCIYCAAQYRGKKILWRKTPFVEGWH